MMRLMLFVGFVILSSAAAFSSVMKGRAIVVVPQANDKLIRYAAPLMMSNRDASRSGTKRERLDRLAELEEDRIETDKGVVVKAAGAFIGLLVILLAVAMNTVEGPI